MSIQSFGDKTTRRFFEEGALPKKGCGWGGVREIVARKLDMIHAAYGVDDLRSPPGNQLHALKGDLDGFYSVRINAQWRVIFLWGPSGPARVEVTDYHR